MRLPVSALVPALFAITAPLWSADSTFHHPEGFSVLVPDGWKSESQAAGVVVSKGVANVDIFVIPGSGSPESLIEMVVPQLIKQWRTANKIKQSACTVAGSGGSCAWYSGINPKGDATELKIAALAQAGKGYLLFTETPHQNANAFTADLARIERSFSPDAAGPQRADEAPASHPSDTHPMDAQKMAALDKAYQDGEISTEDYERRKQELQTGKPSAAPAPPRASSAPPPAVQGRPQENPAPADQPPAQPPVQPREEPPRNPARSGNGRVFASPDGFFTTVVPSGWTAVPSGPLNNGAYFFAPSNGGAERIMIGSGPLYVNNIQQVLASAFTTIGTLYPGLRVAGQPSYFQHDTLPAAQFYMRGPLATGVLASAWYGVVMAGNRYVYVFSLAVPRSAARVEQDAQAMFNQFRF